MSVSRKTDLDVIIDRLTHIKAQVEISGQNNLTDIHTYAENLYRDLLNLVLGINLENINIEEKNSAAIDLGDKVVKLAIQVTSTSDLGKIKKTVKKFTENNLHDTYERLVILNIVRKKKYQKKVIGDSSTYELNLKEDVWDVSDIFTLIGDKDISSIQEIRKFLEEQVKYENVSTIAKEINTFESLIFLLSDENHPGVGGGFLQEPDPNGKINERFSDHAELLKNEFTELFSEYGEVLADVKKTSDLGHVKLRRLSIYLKTHSDSVLSDCGGDPKVALNKLVKEFEGKLQKGGVDFDSIAIRFFLIDELVRCNVFPNKETVNA